MQLVEYFEKDNQGPSIVDMCGQWANDEIKTRVIDYLLAAEHHRFMSMDKPLTNGFTGAPVQESLSLFSDGTYSWTGDLPLYVRDYDVVLPDDFVDYVMNSAEPCTPLFDWKRYRHPYPSLATLAREYRSRQ